MSRCPFCGHPNLTVADVICPSCGESLDGASSVQMDSEAESARSFEHFDELLSDDPKSNALGSDVPDWLDQGYQSTAPIPANRSNKSVSLAQPERHAEVPLSTNVTANKQKLVANATSMWIFCASMIAGAFLFLSWVLDSGDVQVSRSWQNLPGVNQGLVDLESGRYSAAVQHLRDAYERNGDGRILPALAVAYARTGQPEQAKRAMLEYRQMQLSSGSKEQKGVQ